MGMTGIKIDDHMASIELGREAARFASALLRDGGWFITKIFAGALADEHRRELGSHFARVRIKKPLASRKTSPELYFVCSQFRDGHDSKGTFDPLTSDLGGGTTDL